MNKRWGKSWLESWIRGCSCQRAAVKTHYDVSWDQTLHCLAFHNSQKLVIASVEPAKYFHLFIFLTFPFPPPLSTIISTGVTLSVSIIEALALSVYTLWYCFVIEFKRPGLLEIVAHFFIFLFFFCGCQENNRSQ